MRTWTIKKYIHIHNITSAIFVDAIKEDEVREGTQSDQGIGGYFRWEEGRVLSEDGRSEGRPAWSEVIWDLEDEGSR